MMLLVGILIVLNLNTLGFILDLIWCFEQQVFLEVHPWAWWIVITTVLIDGLLISGEIQLRRERRRA